jgi:hypothetical protein
MQPVGKQEVGRGDPETQRLRVKLLPEGEVPGRGVCNSVWDDDQSLLHSGELDLETRPNEVNL